MRRLYVLLLFVALAALVGETTDVLCAEAGCGLVHACSEAPGNTQDAHPDTCDDASAAAEACLCHALFLNLAGHAPALALGGRVRPALPPHAEPARPLARTDAVPVPPPLG